MTEPSKKRRKCAVCSRLYRLDEAGLLPTHYFARSFGSEPRRCAGSQRTPESAKALAVSRAVVTNERKAAKPE